jgi:hypothetical protein
MSRRVVTGLLRWTGEQVDSFHASQDLLGHGWVSWASAAPVPYWFNLAQEFTERWIHQQQMRAAVGIVADHETGALVPPTGITTDGDPAVCDALTSVRAIIV